VTTSVDDGNAVLTGEVDDLRAKNAAENLAEMTVGVWDVDNFIRIDSPDAVRDSSLESDLKLALLRDPYVDRFGITVEVINGHAHLYGEVDTEYEKTRAELEAERALLAALGGTCHSPVAVLCTHGPREMRMHAAIFAPDGSERVEGEAAFAPGDHAGAAALAEDLLSRASAAVTEHFNGA